MSRSAVPSAGCARRATGRRGRWSTRVPSALLAVLLAGAPVGGTGSAGLAAQEGEEPSAAPPAMPEAPRQFRVGVTGSFVAWETVEGRPEIDDEAAFGLDFESLLARYVSLRFGVAVGPGSARNAERSEELVQYYIDAMFLGRADFGVFRRTGLIPFAGLGLGVVLQDPDDDPAKDLTTKSQTYIPVGGGLEFPLPVLPGQRFGGRLEWRHQFVQQEDLFDVMDTTGKTVDTDRFMLGIFWEF